MKKLIQEHYFFIAGILLEKLLNAPESTHSKSYLVREVMGDFFGWDFGLFAVARIVKGIPLSIGTPPNSPLISNT